ncbi:MAG TPA: hypothetical protein VGK34_08645, partial [Armatimonadota bacterium]
MISKFVAIRSIGKFEDCKSSGDVTFRKLTLIYGENGRGKTTLGDILRSLTTGEGAHILGRRTLGSEYPPSATVLLNGSTAVNFKDGKWDAVGPRAAIYDSTFISENVYSGDYVDHDHRKNLYRVIVGEEGVALAKQVDDYDVLIRDANKDLSAKSNTVKAHLPAGFQIEEFVGLKPDQEIKAKISRKRSEVNALERSAEIQKTLPLSCLALPQLPDNFEQLLTKLLDDVSKEAEDLVKGHIGNHAKTGGEQWIAQGLTFFDSTRCPFCGQDISGFDLIAAYKKFFSEAYASFKKDLFALQEVVEKSLGEAALLKIQKSIAENTALAVFWGEFVAITVPAFSFSDFQTPIADLRKAALGRLKAKLASPLESAPQDVEFGRVVSDHQGANALAIAYNAAVATANDLIKIKKTETEAGNLSAAKAELAALQAVEKRYQPPVDEACRLYLDVVAAKSKLEEQKASAKSKLDEYCEQ